MSAPPSPNLTLTAALDDEALIRLVELVAERVTERLQSRPVCEDRWLGARAAAEHLGMSLHALHRLTAERVIPFEQDGPGCKLWFQVAELDRWRRKGGARRHGSASTPLPHARGGPS